MKAILLSVVLLLQPLQSSFQLPTTSFYDTIDKNETQSLVYNLQDNRVVYEQGGYDLVYPASITKVMSALVAIEKIQDLNETVSIQIDALEGLAEENASVAGFKAHEVVTYKDLLVATLLPSGADAVNQLGYSLFGSVEEMVVRMNEKASELGLKHTHFINPTGLHDDNHYSTPYELALIMKAAIEYPEIKEILTYTTYTTSTNLTLRSTIPSFNGSSNIPLTGFKTGYTLEAERCIASYYEYDNETIITVVTHANGEDRESAYTKAISLNEEITHSMDRETIINKGDVLMDFDVEDADKQTYSYISNTSYSYYVNENSSLHYKVTLQKNISAPIKKDDTLGTLTIYDNDEVVDIITLKSKEDIGVNVIRESIRTFMQFVERNIMIILSCFLLLVVLGIIYKKKRRTI